MYLKNIGGEKISIAVFSLRYLTRLKPFFSYLKNKYYTYSVDVFLLGMKRAKLVGELVSKRQEIIKTTEKLGQIKLGRSTLRYKKRIKIEKQYIDNLNIDIKLLIKQLKKVNTELEVRQKALAEIWEIIKK